MYPSVFVMVYFPLAAATALLLFLLMLLLLLLLLMLLLVLLLVLVLLLLEVTLLLLLCLLLVLVFLPPFVLSFPSLLMQFLSICIATADISVFVLIVVLTPESSAVDYLGFRFIYFDDYSFQPQDRYLRFCVMCVVMTRIHVQINTHVSFQSQSTY